MSEIGLKFHSNCICHFPEVKFLLYSTLFYINLFKCNKQQITTHLSSIFLKITNLNNTGATHRQHRRSMDSTKNNQHLTQKINNNHANNIRFMDTLMYLSKCHMILLKSTWPSNTKNKLKPNSKHSQLKKPINAK